MYFLKVLSESRALFRAAFAELTLSIRALLMCTLNDSSRPVCLFSGIAISYVQSDSRSTDYGLGTEE